MSKDHKKHAIHFIVLFGMVSLFGDMAYEGARSVNGPYLQLLAANALTVGIIAGIGEFLGYVLRLLSGYLSDRTKSYWLLTFIGYGLLLSVPLLSLAGIWQVAAVFIVLERIGKAIRSPARDTILSQASSQVGTGFGFGLHEAMDQIGAIAGPFVFTVLFVLAGRKTVGLLEYQKGYAFLGVPVLLVILCLFVAYRRLPRPGALEASTQTTKVPDTLSKVFWLYTLFTFVATAGFCNFILIAFHFKLRSIFSDAFIPVFYALAMGVDAAAALIIGKMYDVLKSKNDNRNAGLNLLIIIPLLSLFIPALVFVENYAFIIIGLCLWGIVLGIHETIMRSAIADIISLKKRGTGYGIFNTTYGLGVFLGSVLLGFLYDRSIPLLVAAAFFLQVAAIVVFFFMKKEIVKKS